MFNKHYLCYREEDYEAFLQECFKPYGITPENVLEYKDRVKVESYKPISRFDGVAQEGLFYKEYFLDGEYIFSVKTIVGHEEFAPGSYRLVVRYEKFVKGESDENQI